MNIDILSPHERLVPGAVARIDTSFIFDHEEQGLFRIDDYQLVTNTNTLIVGGTTDTFDFVELPDGFVVNVSIVLTIPESLVVLEKEDFYLRYTFATDDRTGQHSVSQALEIWESEEVEFGLLDSVSGFNVPFCLQGTIKLDQQEDIFIAVQTPDNMELSRLRVSPQGAGSGRWKVDTVFDTGNIWWFVNGTTETLVHDPVILDGFTYQVDGNTFGYDASRSMQLFAAPGLDPYIAVWSTDSRLLGSTSHWMMNHIIADAVKEFYASIERGTRFTGLSESLITNEEAVRFLKMGRDLFNSLEYFSTFTMLGADGMMRRMWLLCAAYEALFSRQLEEGIKQFDFSGQSTSLSVNIDSAYDLAKSTIESQIDSTVKPFKRKLAARGITGGDGSDQQISSGRVQTSLGLTYSSVGNAGYRFVGLNTHYLRTKLVMF